jgi:hypothetical protein
MRVGDRVQIINGDTGIVVAAMDDDEYSHDYPKVNYGYLKTGIMILTDKGARVHLEESSHQNLVSRITE